MVGRDGGDSIWPCHTICHIFTRRLEMNMMCQSINTNINWHHLLSNHSLMLNTLDIREKVNHFVAINQVNVSEFKHLIGTILLFISAGGIHKILIKNADFKNVSNEVIYYITVATVGSAMYLKLV